MIASGFLHSANSAIAGALVVLYVKCGKFFEARRVFSRTEEKDVISWTVLMFRISIYLKCGMIDEAERLFGEMPVRNVISWTFMITFMLWKAWSWQKGNSSLQ